MRSELLPWHHRGLIWQFTRREVQSRYRGTLLGIAWSLLTPLLTLAVYTFVFQEVLNARWPQSTNQDTLDFALRVYAGLIAFNLLADIANRAPHLITQQPNLVKKVVFPLHILPWVAVLSALFQAMLNLVVLLLVAAIGQRLHGASWVVAPLILLAIVPLLVGISWALSALGVYLRDIAQFTGTVIALLMFLSPIFYPVTALPQQWQNWLWLNPLSLVIEQLRGCLVDGQWPSLGPLCVYLITTSALAWLGLRCFQLTQKGFADVL